ncbi:MAG: CAP domain-containing protein [Solirubrobacterales bacterium]
MRFSFLVFAAVAVAVLVFAGAASARGISKGPRAQQSFAFSSEEVAPASTCPGQTAMNLSADEQAGVMLCMTNYARAAHGLVPLALNRQLGRAAEQKSADIVGCDEFSHEACGRPFQFWIQRYGYLKGCWRAAENIAWGTGSYATVGSIFTAWLESPEHHANILGPYREIGIGMRDGEVEGEEDAAVWTQDFGSHKC